MASSRFHNRDWLVPSSSFSWWTPNETCISVLAQEQDALSSLHSSQHTYTVSMCFYWHNCIYISIWCVQCTSGFNGTDRTRVQKFQPISQLQDFTHPSPWLLYKDHQQRQQLKTTAVVFFGICTWGIQLTLEGFWTVGYTPARKKQLFRRLSLGFFPSFPRW